MARRKNTTWKWVLGGITATVFAFVLASVGKDDPNQAAPVEVSDATTATAAFEPSPAKGPVDAAVVIHEISEFQ
jgi:hypothetical protein